MKRIILCCILAVSAFALAAQAATRNPQALRDFLNRIGGQGTADRFELVVDETLVTTSGKDVFVLTSENGKPCIQGNTPLSVATGVNWYLNHVARINLAWNNGVRAALVHANLPLPAGTEKHNSTADYRYYFNYCTFSYSMAFWTWERWQQEIDWMALHGINMPLSLVGVDVVWRNVLLELGYTKAEINDFIAGPGFQAWWMMNNLEGWGGVNPDWWYDRQEKLAKNVLGRMRALGMEPILAGYSGMVPNNAKAKLGWNVADPGLWCQFRRPAFLLPTDAKFADMAALYYKHLHALMGTSAYYSMDPFHEGGNTNGVDLPSAYRAIQGAMDKARPGALWVIQGWNENPRQECLTTIAKGKLLVLDLFSDGTPKWQNGYNGHDFVYCMLHNFGGRVGLHGRLESTMKGYYQALREKPSQMKGVGATPEAIETNPMLYDALFELPWVGETAADKWLESYAESRYNAKNADAQKAWEYLRRSVYDCKTSQQGTSEPIICARPALEVNKVSTWSTSRIYYDRQDVIRAAGHLLNAGGTLSGDNYNYDLIDVVRQSLTDRASTLLQQIKAAYDKKNNPLFLALKDEFLQLILDQDRLLSTHPGFSLGTWTGMARRITEEVTGTTTADKEWLEWNARTQITVWGPKASANGGGLHDYSNREWGGLLRDFHYKRWEAFFNALVKKTAQPDWFDMEEAWTRDFTKAYHDQPSTEQTLAVGRELFAKYFATLSVSPEKRYYCAYREEADWSSEVVLSAYRGETFTAPLDLKAGITAQMSVDLNGNGLYEDNEKFSALTFNVAAAAQTGTKAARIVLSDGTTMTFQVAVADRITAPRTVAVASANTAQGTVAIKGTTAASVSTTDYVEVTATPVVGYDFVSWTDAKGNVLSRTASFIYYGKESVSLTANFQLNRWGIPTQDKGEWNVINSYGQWVKEFGLTRAALPRQTIYTADATPQELFVTIPRVINVARGSSLRLHWNDANGSGLSYTRLSAYLDRNADGDFADTDELLAVKGTANAQTASLSNDSIAFVVGKGMPLGITHLRLRFDGAWSGGWDAVTGAKPAKASTNRMVYEILINVTELPDFPLTLQAQSGQPNRGTATISGAGDKAVVQPGESIILQAQPQSGYAFLHWTDPNGKVVSTEANYSFVPIENGTYTAHFQLVLPETLSLNGWEFRYQFENNRITLLDAVKGEGEMNLPAAYTIGNESFPIVALAPGFLKNNTAVTAIAIPASLTNIGQGAAGGAVLFEGCTNLKSLSVDAKNTAYMVHQGVALMNKEGSELLRYVPAAPARAYTMSSTVRNVAPYAFTGTLYLERVEAARSLATIASKAFEGSTAYCQVLASKIPTAMTWEGTRLMVSARSSVVLTAAQVEKAHLLELQGNDAEQSSVSSHLPAMNAWLARTFVADGFHALYFPATLKSVVATVDGAARPLDLATDFKCYTYNGATFVSATLESDGSLRAGAYLVRPAAQWLNQPLIFKMAENLPWTAAPAAGFTGNATLANTTLPAGAYLYDTATNVFLPAAEGTVLSPFRAYLKPLTTDAPPSIPGITAISSLVSDAMPHVIVKDGRIHLTPAVPFSLFTSSGRALAPDALLPAGIYLVKTAQGVEKVVVKS